MVVAQERTENRYESAGINSAIAESVTEIQQRQQNGEPLDDIDREILAFADGVVEKQEQLQTLPQYQDSLESNGFEAASAEYKDQVPEIRDLTTPESVEERQILIAANLQDEGVDPQTSDDINERASRLERSAAATVATTTLADNELPMGGEGEGNPQLSAEQQMVADAEGFMNNARKAGLVSKDDALQGSNYTITQQGDTTIIEGDGKRLVADGGEVLKSDGFGPEDYAAFNALGQRSPDELQQAQQEEQGSNGQARERRQQQLSVQKSQDVEL